MKIPNTGARIITCESHMDAEHLVRILSDSIFAGIGAIFFAVLSESDGYVVKSIGLGGSDYDNARIYALGANDMMESYEDDLS